MRNEEARLNNLMTGKKDKKVSPRQYLIDNQDNIPLCIMVAYLDKIRERMVIADGKIKRFE